MICLASSSASQAMITFQPRLIEVKTNFRFVAPGFYRHLERKKEKNKDRQINKVYLHSHLRPLTYASAPNLTVPLSQRRAEHAAAPHGSFSSPTFRYNI